jgi:2,3-bisphosphoglycerate-dependent phosphoglycerate mutase
MELLLIRHGLPIRVEGAGGPADPPLSPDGVAQAEALAAWLAPLGVDALYSSPLRRARETAAPLGDTLGLDVVIDAGIEEYDAHLPEYIPIEELRADPVRWKQAVDEWSSTEANDLRQTFRRRVVDAIEAIVPRHRSQRVAIVCHGGVINAYLSHVIGLRDAIFFEPAYTSVSRVIAGAERRQMVSANETPHLAGLVVPSSAR